VRRVTIASMPPLPDVPATEWAWAAGFFDGEGCVCSWLRKDAGTYCLSVILVNTNEEAMQRFGRLVLKHPNRRQAFANVKSFGSSRLPCFVLKVTGEFAKRLLRELLPYSTVKRGQIVAALQFPISHRSHPDKERVMRMQAQVYAELRRLNRTLKI